MNTYHARPKSAAALLATLLFTLLAVVGRAQTSAPASPATKEEEDSSEVVTLEKLTVTTGYRSPKAIDQIPGAIKLISFEEVANTQFLTEDATEVLARTIPGYSPATQQLQNTGENLRGDVPGVVKRAG